MSAPTPSPFVLLRLRWLQVRRALPAYGIVLLAIALCGAVWLMHGAVTADPSLAPYIGGGALLVAFGLHQQRPDLPFLQRHVPVYRPAMVMEYAALVLPALLALLLAASWMSAAVASLACLLPWSPVVRTSNVRGVWLRKRVPTRLFEWKSLVQATYPWSLLLWLAALVLCWLPMLPLFLLGALALMACGAMEQCEPRSMLLVTARDARALLRSKTLGASGLMLVLELPVLIGATVFQPQWWWIHGLFGLGMLVLVAYAVVLKYANYHPNERLSANSANVGTAMVFAILPGLSIVPLIMLLGELRKARENLLTYFHDHHH